MNDIRIHSDGSSVMWNGQIVARYSLRGWAVPFGVDGERARVVMSAIFSSDGEADPPTLLGLVRTKAAEASGQ